MKLLITLSAIILLSSCMKILNRDNDLIKDYMDNCPRLAEDYDQFMDDDGCPEYDNDNDNIPDSLDLCINDAEDRDQFQDHDGCPELDNDSDGIADLQDQCPNIPETVNLFEDSDGCPDELVDSDGDSIPDINDACRNEPEDFDQFQDEDGCPEPDNDNDRIVDSLDQCPDNPETYNEFEDYDGCPDHVYRVQGRPYSPLIRTINYTSNSTALDADSYDILDTILSALLDSPEVRIKVIGHSDAQGAEAINQQVSLNRAQVVIDYFIMMGLSSERFEIEGRGSSDPIGSFDTEEGRALNRRVEFERIY